MTWWLLTLLPYLLVAAAARSMMDKCPRLVRCEQPIRSENIFSGPEGMLFQINDATTLDSVCGKEPALKTCVTENKDSCYAIDTEMDVLHFRDIIEYICSEEGRPVALATQNATCTVDSDLEDEFMSMILLDCSYDFYGDLYDREYRLGREPTAAETCGLKAALDNCVKTRTTSKCGEQMGAMVAKMFEFYSTYMFPNYSVCSNSRKRSATRQKRQYYTVGTRWQGVRRW